MFKGSHRGESCFILGNGPSLTPDLIIDVARKNKFIFVSNGFGLILKDVDVKVGAVCMSNNDAVRKYLRLYPEATLKFVKKGSGAAGAANVHELPFECEHDLGLHRAKFIKDGYFTDDPFEENYCGDTVILDFCFPLAYFMGFDRIYLGGVDCDYSKGYFHKDYEMAEAPGLKGMRNDDFSIAIPAYRYVYDLLSGRNVTVQKFTKSERLGFIPDVKIEEIR